MPNGDTAMWVVELECDWHGVPTVQVIDVDIIARAAHLWVQQSPR
jgi:hypothetical protein